MQLSTLFAPGPGRLLLVAGSLAMFALGASQALYGPFFPYFSDTLGVTPSRLGLLPGLHFAGATIGVLGGGFAARRWGYRWLLRVGGAVLTAGYLAAAIAGTWSALLVGVAFLGLGFGLLVNFNILVDEAFGAVGAAALQLINATFSIGAISAPLLAVASLQIGGQGLAFGIGGAVAAMLTALLFFGHDSADRMVAAQRAVVASAAAERAVAERADGVAAGGADGLPVGAANGGPGGTSVASASVSSARVDAVSESASESASTRAGAANASRAHQRALLVPIALFLPLYLIYPGAEASFSNWMPTHLFSLLPVAVASAVASGFWLMFTVGRLIAVPLIVRLRPGTMVGVAVVLAGAAALTATVDAAAPVAYLVAGLALGPIFPGGLSWLRRRYPARAGEVASIIIAAGGIGGMLIPPALGVVVERWGAGAVPVALTAVLTLAILLTALIGVSGRRGT